jgi:hypothetical protein
VRVTPLFIVREPVPDMRRVSPVEISTFVDIVTVPDTVHVELLYDRPEPVHHELRSVAA